MMLTEQSEEADAQVIEDACLCFGLEPDDVDVWFEAGLYFVRFWDDSVPGDRTYRVTEEPPVIGKHPTILFSEI